jgi:hypothetical protein
MTKLAVIFSVLVTLLTRNAATAAPVSALQGRDINGNATLTNTDPNAFFEYDPNLNVTWLRDWNYPETSSYGTFTCKPASPSDPQGIIGCPRGVLGWSSAMNWANTLSVGGFTGWALPITYATTDTTCSSSGGDPMQYAGYNCTGSPIGYLWYVELGNTAGSFTNAGPFLNMKSSSYWTRLVYEPDPAYVRWVFFTANGLLVPEGVQKYDSNFTVAVRLGDVCTENCNPVPVPATIALLGLGLIGISAARRKQV